MTRFRTMSLPWTSTLHNTHSCQSATGGVTLSISLIILWCMSPKVAPAHLPLVLTKLYPASYSCKSEGRSLSCFCETFTVHHELSAAWHFTGFIVSWNEGWSPVKIARQIRLFNANQSDVRFWNNIDEMCEHGQALRTRLKPVCLFWYYLISFIMVPIEYL